MRIRGSLKGTFAPLITPFGADGHPAIDALRDIIDFLSSHGVTGVIPADIAGECYALTFDERQLLIEETVKAAAGRISVVALVSDPSLEKAIELAHFAKGVGADAIKLGLPYPFKPADGAIVEYFSRIETAVDMPFLIESSDELTIPHQVLETLAKSPNFCGLEELGSNLGRLERLVREFGERLAILPSGETAMLYVSLLGAPGLIATECNFAPVFMRRFLMACQAGNLADALDLFGRRLRYRGLFRARLADGVPMYAPYTKAAMALLGFGVGQPRLPHEQLTSSEIEELRAVLNAEFSLQLP